MSEEFILQLIPQRIKQLGYHSYQIRYRDITVKGNSKVLIPAFNELWFIANDPPGLTVESGYGVYDSTGAYVFDNSHLHRGEILISNADNENRRIKFIQVIIVN